MKALVWPVVTYGCESRTLRKNEETRLEAFEMKGLRKILRDLSLTRAIPESLTGELLVIKRYTNRHFTSTQRIVSQWGPLPSRTYTSLSSVRPQFATLTAIITRNKSNVSKTVQYRQDYINIDILTAAICTTNTILDFEK